MAIIDVVSAQLNNVFCAADNELDTVKQYHHIAYDRAMTSVSGFNNKYLTSELSPFNSVIYCNYLYWLSRTLFENGENTIADKVYYLNKMLNCVDLFYAIELPET
jgi:serine O-acetyltransferase